MDPSLRKTVTRYFWFQVPGWILAGIVLWFLHRWVILPAWAAVGIFVLWFVKDVALFPLLRRAYEPGASTALERLIGQRGVVIDTLASAGYIKLRGELWWAELPPAHDALAAGDVVVVRSTRGLTLLVQRPPDA